MPPKPQFDLCIHDQPREAVYCNNNTTGNEYDLKIGDTDKYLMLSPDDYGEILKYIRILEYRLQNSKKGKKLLKEFRD